MNNDACCAHVWVTLKHKDYADGTRSDYWECDSGCGKKFWPEEQITRPRSLRLFNGQRIKIAVQWEPRGLWIGLFWGKTYLCRHFYICLVPLLPIHITTLRHERPYRPPE